MKLYQSGRSIFSKVNNITESLEKCLDKVVSRGEKNFSVHKKYMNFLTHRKTALDEYLYKLSVGRSMVEMLGVLAIIGVLSVGAIAGYSKAMMKHKLNKQAEQLNFLFSGTMQYVGRLRGHAGSNYMNPTLAKLGVISEEMIKKEGDSEKYADVFGNTFDIYVIESNTITGNININFKINHSNNFEICQNMFSISGEYTENLNGVQVYNNSGISQTWYGPEDCKTYDTYPCIMDLTQTQILEVCSQLEPSTEWHFTIDWGVSTS